MTGIANETIKCRTKNKKHLLHFRDLSKQDIRHIFELADRLKSGSNASDLLAGKTVVLFFPESSIRTRVSFEKGIRLLGGDSILFPSEALDKKEDIKDVTGYLENWADMVIVRYRDLALIEYMSECSDIPIINAMTSENHPCEILADLYALSLKYDDYLNKKYLFMGARGNIGNTWKSASDVLGFAFTQCCPTGYEIVGADVCYDIKQAVADKDIICTDSISSSAKEDFKDFQITLETLKLAKEHACLNPCPPFFRGEEVSADAIDSKYFVGYGFKKNLLEVQQAVICYLLGCQVS